MAAVIGLQVRAGREHDRDQQVVPDPEELEDPEGRDCRHQQRQQHDEEDLHVPGAVDPGCLDDRGRNLLHEVVQQEDRQRQAEDRVRDPHRPERVLQAEVDEDRLQRDQRHLDRHDLQGEDRDEQEVAALEIDPGKA